MSKHISGEYDKELQILQTTLTTLGGVAEQQLENAMRAFLTNDSKLAAQVKATELQINRYAIELDREVTSVIARRQPAAADLRLIVSILKNGTDIERVGDEAERIAKMSDRLSLYDSSRPYHGPLTELYGRVSNALRTSLDVYARLDVETALQTIAGDREVDALYDVVVKKVTDEMTSNQSRLTSELSIIWVARSLERISDHAKNICETVVYLVHGQNIMHNVL
ncbi:MAG: phosphate signaling complex protein PhoU [Gammaproteobacteria bacterium]|nr:phosphate signaling complex protein PhoU [Gammaproteobacteria bacterium]MYD79439.1 phosphate signaling complex protein PhoU [Gammaproteobacteria bacterium]